MERVFENFTVTVLKLSKLVQRIKTYEMREYGLKAIHVMCGYYLDLHPEGLTAAELVKYTFEDKAAISRALSQLKEKGFVEYDPKKYNSAVKLTAAGKEFARFIADKSDKAVEAGSAKLSEKERALFYKALGEISVNLQAYYEGLTERKGE